MSTKHTPGPWSFIEKTGDGKRIIIESHQDGTWERMTCEVDSDDCCSETAMANARLIAAAPELLEAIEFAEIILSNTEISGVKQLANGQALDRVREAIRKAKGRQ